MTKPKTPLKYPGGKHYLAKQIVDLMPPHTRYVETHFGGGAVLFAKSPDGASEYVNDIDGELANFWRCLRMEGFALVHKWLECTPFSKEEFERANPAHLRQIIGEFDLYRAYKFFIRNRQSRQGLGKGFATPTSRTRRGMNENVSAWLSAIEGLPEVHARLKRVEIRNQDAVKLIRELDSPDTLFYTDAPYVHDTRESKKLYRFEMTDEQHRDLVDTLRQIKGKAIVSMYHHSIYDPLATVYGWNLIEFNLPNHSSSKKQKERKIECAWKNF